MASPAASPLEQSSPPSEDVIRALSDLVKAAGSHAHSGPEWLRSVAELISAISWPLVVFFLVISFRPEVIVLLNRLTEIEFLGIKGKVRNELIESAQEAARLDGKSQGPTPNEIQRANQVEALTSKTDLSFIRQQVQDLATEYEKVRSSMRSSDARTRAMEIVVSKMRTIAKAAYPLRYELTTSASPGKRLQAITCLQITPDYDLLDWLANRLRAERPFVSYHALVALNTAAADDGASDHLSELEHALQTAEGAREVFGDDTDRKVLLDQFSQRVSRLRSMKRAG
jgi:hypothetical protein